MDAYEVQMRDGGARDGGQRMSTFRPSIVEPLNKRTHLRRHAIRGRRLKVKLALTDGPDVLTRIASGHPNRQLDGLFPWAYRHGYNPV